MIYYIRFAIFSITNAMLIDINGIFTKYENITSKTYNQETEICCNDVIHIKKSSNQDCCHSSIYDLTTEACCNGEKYKKSTQTCCKNMDRGFFYTELYMSDVKVVDGTKDKFCCGGEVLENEYKQLCCGGKIYPNDNMTLDCCDLNVIFDTSKQICCSETFKVIDKKDVNDDECCNGNTYNSMKQVCCKEKGTIIDKQRINDNACCNEISYNPYQHKCCGDTLIDLNDNERCCNDTFYNSKIEMCCNDKILKKQRADDLCCNSQLYNFETEICCNGTVYPMESGICCFFEWHEIFHAVPNANVSQCCGFDLLSKSDLGTPKEYCCKHGYQYQMLYDNNDEKRFECCGFNPYDPLKEVCCGKYINRKLENNKSSCCLYTVLMNETTENFW